MIHPERLGKYEIRATLGKGAMGLVYKGFDPHIERYVAIKTIRKDMVETELAAQYMARFKNEAKAAGRLQHPNIVAVYEYGEDDEVTYIAMEYVEGFGLREYLNRRASFDFAQLTALLEQVLDALEYAHSRGVVHRDIKPSNLIVTDSGTLKIADFGIARVDMTNLTIAGMVIGTPSYMSPEQCRGLEADQRSDLFSTGVVLYELLTGHKPFRGNLESVAYKICHEEPEPPSQLSTLKLPNAVDKLISTALAKNPASRFQDARAFRDALRDVANMSVEVEDGQGTTMIDIGTMVLQKPEPAWDDDTLRTAERVLARAVGPMAKYIVRRAAQQTNDRGELCSILSDNITDPDLRRKFVDAFNRTVSGVNAGTTSATRSASGLHPSTGGRVPTGSHPHTVSSPSTHSSAPSGSATVHAPLEQEFVDHVTARLALYLGPIARVVTRKAARDAKSRSDFIHRVADSLGTQERATFLREVGMSRE